MNLATLQSQFAKALHYQTSGEDCGITADQFSADERIQIYRNNFIISLSEVLSATYPMVEALVGEACFAQIARQHVLSHPLTEGHVTHYGKGFHKTIKKFDQVMSHAPYCAEVARFEWCLDMTRQTHCNARTTENLIPLADLAHVNESQQPNLVFHLRAGCSGFDSNYAVFDLFHAIQSQQLEQLNINQPQQGVMAYQRDQVVCYKLTPQVFRVLCALENKLSLGEMPKVMLDELNHITALGLIDGFTIKEM